MVSVLLALLAPLQVTALALRAAPDGTPKFGTDHFYASGNYMPASEYGRMYHSVVKALWGVACDNQLAHAKKDMDTMPKAELDGWCSQWYEGAEFGSLSECQGIVAELESEFDKDPEEFSAKDFCGKMWAMMADDAAAEIAAKEEALDAKQAAGSEEGGK